MSASSARSVPMVAHVIQHLIIGGLENGLVNIINRTPPERMRHAVICLSHFSDFRERVRNPAVPIVSLGKRQGKDPANLLKLWRTLRALRPAIVHSRNLATIDCAPISRLAGVGAHVHGEHGWDVLDLHGHDRKYRRYRRWMRPFVTRYVAVSRDIERWLASSIGVAPSRIVQIYNGVDTSRFTPASSGDPVVADLPFERRDDLMIVGTVGRMERVKDPLTLARAFVQLVRESEDLRRRVRLMMIGTGALRAEVQQVLAEGGVENLAWLPGARNDVPETLRAMDLFVLPSLNEGISNTILEAMATGLPVVATAVGGNGELIVPGQTGELVPPNDPEAMAAALRTLLCDPARLRAQGVAARARAEQLFGLDSMVERYLSLYETLLARPQAAN